MATAASTFAPFDRAAPPQNDRFGTINYGSTAPRPGQHLDDADLLAWKRQFAKIGLRDQNVMSSSAEDLSQLDDRSPYQFEVLGPDYNDMDDDEIHLDNSGYDYDAVIQERLKRANEEFEHDQTPAELKHRQRVSFDALVKAVDIVQDPAEYSTVDAVAKKSISPVTEEPPTSAQSEADGHAYTVPLNDTQPKEGLTLLEQLKALQFHGALPVTERLSPTNSSATTTVNGEGTTSSLTGQPQNNDDDDDDDDDDIPDITTKATTKTSHTAATTSSTSQKPMLVSINGGFHLQNEGDYLAEQQTLERSSHQNNSERTTPNKSKVSFIPAPPTQAKQQQDPLKPIAPRRPPPPGVRPKSSDSGRRSDVLNNTMSSNSSSDSKNKTNSSDRERPKSAGTLQSIEGFYEKPKPGVDFDELLRKAAEKKRAERREELRKKEQSDAKRKIELAKAQEAFERWVRDKDSERKRLNEEKRLEKEEEETRRVKYEEQQSKLRKQKYDEWDHRKKQQQMLADEFEKLKVDEQGTVSGSSASSVNNDNRVADHRAFRRWLRRKHEQSLEEKRQLRLEARRLRRRQRRSLKRFQLQQDLQLAKSFGYS